MMKTAIILICCACALAGCSYSLEESLAKSRLEIVDPTPDGDFSDAFFRDTLTGETCQERQLGRIGCGGT